MLNMNFNLIFNQEIKSFDLRSIYHYVESIYGVFVVNSNQRVCEIK